MTENEGVNTQAGDSPGPSGKQSGPTGLILSQRNLADARVVQAQQQPSRSQPESKSYLLLILVLLQRDMKHCLCEPHTLVVTALESKCLSKHEANEVQWILVAMQGT